MFGRYTNIIWRCSAQNTIQGGASQPRVCMVGRNPADNNPTISCSCLRRNLTYFVGEGGGKEAAIK